MRDDYLWDGSGEPDPQIQKLESTLGRFRHNRAAPEFPEIPISAQPARRARFLALPRWPQWAAVAAAVLVITAVGFLLLRTRPVVVMRSNWDVTRVGGAPRVEGKTMAASETRNLGLGQVLETDPSSKASLRDANTGEIEVEPDTRLRVFAGNSGSKRLTLERGTIHATIWAPPVAK